jgi:hypothetical protein
VQVSTGDKQPPTVDGADATAGAADAWRARDPYQFLPAPEENCKVHTEVTFTDGSVKAYANTKEQLEAHLHVTGGRVCASGSLLLTMLNSV